MIYIVEGIHGSGKTTFIDSLHVEKVELGSGWSILEIKNKIDSLKDNQAVDRLYWLQYANKPNEKIIEINKYLMNNKNIKCYAFFCDPEIGYKRYMEKEYHYDWTYEQYLEHYEQMKRIANLSDLFEIVYT